MKKARGLLVAASTMMVFSSRLFSADLSPDAISTDNAPSSSGLNKIALGEYQMFFIVKGKVRALGSNRADEAGFDKDHGSIPIPAQIITVPKEINFTDVACGGYHSLALDDSGHVWAWGGNDYGNVGIGAADKEFHLPAIVKTDANGDPFDDVAEVGSGFHFCVARKKDGSVWTWGLSGDDKEGYNSTGISGDGDKSSHPETRPVKVKFPDGISIAKISAGMNIIMALDTNGDVWSWGGGERVESRGTGNRDCATPTKLSKLPAHIKDITAGSGCNYAIDADGNLWGWGYEGAYLCLGDGKDFHHPTPYPVKLDFPDLNGHVKAVAVSQLTTHALKDDGTLWGWGDSAMGEVGDGTMNDWANTNPPYYWDWERYEKMIMKPVQVLDNVETVYGSSQAPYVYAVKKDGTIWSWGRNKTGALGNKKELPPSDYVAKHPDTWDVPKPAQVTPF